MGKKLQPASKCQSKISKQNKQKKPKTKETKERDRLKADLSRFKDRLLKAYTRTLPSMMRKSTVQSQQVIKKVSMELALKKFTDFQNNYSKREEQFKLSGIDPRIRLYFWSFVFNLQKYSFQDLSTLPEHILMGHHAAITNDDLEIYITKYLDDFQCKDGIFHFQNRQTKQNTPLKRQNNTSIRKNGKFLYNLIMLTLIMICTLGLFFSTDNGQTKSKGRDLQTDQNPSPSHQNFSIPYGLDITARTKVDLSANQIKKVSQNAALLVIFTFLIIALIGTCVLGVIYLKRFEREKLALEERISCAIQFSFNEILGT